jgi:hypothetical protein
MRDIPSDPYAFQARVMDALMGDIADTKAKGFDRLEALKAASKASRHEKEEAA